MPKRIQCKRIKGWKMPQNTIYVGRPSKWGNTFTTKKLSGIKGIVEAYKTTLSDKLIREAKIELKGKNLACWCPLDRPCHADVLLKIANV